MMNPHFNSLGVYNLLKRFASLHLRQSNIEINTDDVRSANGGSELKRTRFFVRGERIEGPGGRDGRRWNVHVGGIAQSHAVDIHPERPRHTWGADRCCLKVFVIRRNRLQVIVMS